MTAAKLVDADSYHIADVLEEQVARQELVRLETPEGPFIYLPRYYEAECYVASKLSLMLQKLPGEEPLPDAQGAVDRLEAAQRVGIARERLCFDPGVGFGKTVEENLDLIAHVERTKVEGCAFLMAASRKRVTGAFCGNPPFEERLPATLAAHTASILGGADLVRVHDVKEAVQAARMADALKRR